MFNDQYVNCTVAPIDIVTLKQFEIIQAISFLFFSAFLQEKELIYGHWIMVSLHVVMKT